MEKPQITWCAKLRKQETFENGERFYAGTYVDSEPLLVDIQLWNNRYGLTDVESLKDFDIELYFDNVEDEALLDYCSIAITNKEQISLKRIGSRGIVQFPEPQVISGAKNNGDPAEAYNNYIGLTLSFAAAGKCLKENDLKSLNFEIVQR